LTVNQTRFELANNTIINQHFGLQSHTQIIKPICGCVKNYKIKYSIIEHIFLEFDKERTNIQIYYNEKLIGQIKLNLTHLNIEHIIMEHIMIEHKKDISIIEHKKDISIIEHKKDISIHVVFILMNILRAYYAPLPIMLLFKYISEGAHTKQMHDIAFELEFSKYVFINKKKDKEDYYIRKC
jgi:hypothetical protein